MSLFIFSLEESFSPKVRHTIQYVIDEYVGDDEVYLLGPSPVSVIVGEVCAKNNKGYKLFFPYKNLKETENKFDDSFFLNAQSSIFVPIDENSEEDPIKQILKYILEISEVKVCLSNGHLTTIKSLKDILDAGGNYIIFPN
jgi:hypothetical protein